MYVKIVNNYRYILMKDSTVKLGTNELGNNEPSVIVRNKIQFQMTMLLRNTL